MSSPLGDLLESAAASTRRDVLLVAPFIKESVLRRLLDHLRQEVRVRVVTRWHPQEIANGVSDLGCRQLVLQRECHANFLLSQQLHAKYFRFDDQVFLGSANLTAAALGWRPYANLELLVESAPLLDFERQLDGSSIVATDAIQVAMAEAALLLPRFQTPSMALPADEHPAEAGPGRPWLPHSRDPSALAAVYQGDTLDLTEGMINDCVRDLRALQIPKGLEPDAFDKTVAALVVSQRIVAVLANFAREPRRFGAVRDWLETEFSEVAADPSTQTQTLYRWLRHFLADSFEFSRGTHSEVIRSRNTTVV